MVSLMKNEYVKFVNWMKNSCVGAMYENVKDEYKNVFHETDECVLVKSKQSEKYVMMGVIMTVMVR